MQARERPASPALALPAAARRYPAHPAKHTQFCDQESVMICITDTSETQLGCGANNRQGGATPRPTPLQRQRRGRKQGTQQVSGCHQSERSEPRPACERNGEGWECIRPNESTTPQIRCLSSGWPQPGYGWLRKVHVPRPLCPLCCRFGLELLLLSGSGRCRRSVSDRFGTSVGVENFQCNRGCRRSGNRRAWPLGLVGSPKKPERVAA